ELPINGCSYGACTCKLSEPLAKSRERFFQRRVWRAGGCVYHGENFARGFRDHAARGIADGAAERAIRVSEYGPAFEVPHFLSDSFVALAGGAVSEHDGRSDV